MDGAEIGISSMKIAMKMTITFAKDGEMFVTTQLKNADTFQSDLAQALEQMLYTQYANEGLDRSQADAACQAQHGRTVTEFCQFRASQVSKSMKTTDEGVYYVEEGLLYTAEDWGSDMKEETFEITESGKLMLTTAFSEDPTPFTRVAIAK